MMPNPVDSTTPQRRFALLVNAVLFQIGWWACVLGAARGHAWFGPAVTAVCLFAHARVARAPAGEWALVAACFVAGMVLDGINTYWLGLHFAPFADRATTASTMNLGLAPVWIGCAWALFAISLRHSLAWLAMRPWLAAALGAVAGPLSYRAGVALGAGAWDTPAQSVPGLTALAVEWALLTPALLALARRAGPRGAVLSASARG